MRSFERGVTPPPVSLQGWKISTLEGEVFLKKGVEYPDGSVWALGVLRPLDGGRCLPVEVEITRGGVYITPRAGWAGL